LFAALHTITGASPSHTKSVKRFYPENIARLFALATQVFAIIRVRAVAFIHARKNDGITALAATRVTIPRPDGAERSSKLQPHTND
jgi:hypothetical protein